MKLPALLSPLLLILLLVASPAAQGRQSGEIDILLKGGHVIDPANGIDRVMDVAIAGDRIVEVAPNISSRNARRVIDVSGLYVTGRVCMPHRPRPPIVAESSAASCGRCHSGL